MEVIFYFFVPRLMYLMIIVGNNNVAVGSCCSRGVSVCQESSASISAIVVLK